MQFLQYFAVSHIHEREKLFLFGLVIRLEKSLLSLFLLEMKKHFEHLESLLYLYSFPLLNSHPLSFLYHFVIAQIYALTTCLIPRLPEWRRQMSCFWLALIHALRHHFSMLEFERGLYSLVVNKHADPSGFDTMLRWSCRQ